MTRRARAAALSLLSILVVPSGAAAQQAVADSLRAAYRIRSPIIGQIALNTARAPGSSFGSPTAATAEKNDVFAAVAYQSRTRYTPLADGALAAGFGFGDAEGLAALELAFTSFSSVRRGIGEIGSVSVKAARQIASGTYVAAGVENLVNWGNTDGGRSAFAVVSQAWQPIPRAEAGLGDLATSIGFGTGRFQSERASLAHERGVGVFGSVAVRAHRSLAMVVDWTGQDLNAGAAFTPFRRRGVVLRVGWADLAGSAGDGPRFVASLGIGARLNRDNRLPDPLEDTP